jgi:hypothetical protein
MQERERQGRAMGVRLPLVGACLCYIPQRTCLVIKANKQHSARRPRAAARSKQAQRTTHLSKRDSVSLGQPRAWLQALTLPAAPARRPCPRTALLVGLLSADSVGPLSADAACASGVGAWAVASKHIGVPGARSWLAKPTGEDVDAGGWFGGAGLRLQSMLRVRGGVGVEEQGGPVAQEALRRGQECMARYDFAGAVAALTSVRS